MKKPYVKKYCTISKFVVWIVDGKYIRSNLDEEFTNFGQHYRFKFIPKNEFWIDKERGVGDEEKYYTDHLLVENRLMAKGWSYDRAIERADLIERGERKKSDIIKNVKKQNLIIKVHRKLLKFYSKKISVWVVNGKLVRDLFYIDFTEGGHDKVYPFIPPNELWIDDDLSLRERKFILLHELHERKLMAKGWSYDRAHHDSSIIEYFCRHHPEQLDNKLKTEIKNS